MASARSRLRQRGRLICSSSTAPPRGLPSGRSRPVTCIATLATDASEDTTARAGLALSGWGQAACRGDYARRYTDLYVTFFGQNRLFRNRQNGTFEDVTSRAGIATKTRWGAGCAFIASTATAARSVRGELHRPRSETALGDRFGALPVQRRSSRVRAAGPAWWEERAVRNVGGRRFPDVLDSVRHHARVRHERTRREHARFDDDDVDGCVRGETIRIRARSIATSVTGPSRTSP